MLWKPLRGRVENATGANERGTHGTHGTHKWEIRQGGMVSTKEREKKKGAQFFFIFFFIF